MKKYNKIRRVRPHYEENSSFLLGVWQFFVGIFLWLFFIVATGISLYAHWFSQSLIYILRLFKEKNYHVPLWFSIICTIFLFPITLIIILFSALLKIIRGN